MTKIGATRRTKTYYLKVKRKKERLQKNKSCFRKYKNKELELIKNKRKL